MVKNNSDITCEIILLNKYLITHLKNIFLSC